jgi:hypothetical protein
MSESKKGGVRDLIQLLADGLVDLWVFMAVEICPNRGVAVEITPAIGTDEPCPFS